MLIPPYLRESMIEEKVAQIHVALKGIQKEISQVTCISERIIPTYFQYLLLLPCLSLSNTASKGLRQY